MTQAPLWRHRVDRAGTVSTITVSGELDLSAEPGSARRADRRG
jgi:hypothetical protein